MRTLVTGCAGFVGSQLAERLVADGHVVVGIDAFTDYYGSPLKEANLGLLRPRTTFTLVQGNLLDLDLPALLDGVDVVFHLAAQAGVRASWGQAFDVYTSWNILATQRLLEAARDRRLQRFVYASSSAVYGRSELPMREESPTRPLSPYGVSKLAAEHLCGLYAAAYGVPTVSLRYFTVFGPRQRPDMAFHRFIRALRADRPVPVFGDGRQTRDFTFVADVVDATCRAATADVRPGEVLNVAGGARIELGEAIALLERLTGRAARRVAATGAPGEMPHTYADIARAGRCLGWAPKVPIAEGLREEIAWVERAEATGLLAGG
ncbi:MAG: NAD-dependent epimerase/dehydratase family protein [Candidatus Rokuibacteriota bacterium]